MTNSAFQGGGRTLSLSKALATYFHLDEIYSKKSEWLKPIPVKIVLTHVLIIDNQYFTRYKND